MSHHQRWALKHLDVALDALESARNEAEEELGPAVGPNPMSLHIERVLLEVKRAVYDVNTAAWAAAEVTLQSAIGPLSHVARMLARKTSRAEVRIVENLVTARKAIRATVLALRLHRTGKDPRPLSRAMELRDE
jgi:hypothetical protein